ncbi:C47 family peptidase [Enterococcus quebecensis]|uniref:C47 family peptidase n=1 Tax=Enterococcus quebecensis TaxID=903983 RepID=UPI00114CEE15|nr:C47 family peptidase [Enterococcus quebecensis]
MTVGFMLNVGVTKVDAASLYVKSTDVPNETTVLATQNWQDYLNKMMLADNGRSTDYYLGQPFTISYPESTTYNYPIIAKENKQIAYLLQIDSSDSKNPDSFILSKALAKKLEELSLMIPFDGNQAITLDGLNQNIFYEYQGTQQPLLTTNDIDVPDVSSDSQISINIDITEPTAQPNLRMERASVEFETNILPWPVYETQTDQPWCQEFTMASVINYQVGKQVTSASDIIHKSYPRATESQLMDINWVTKQSLNDITNYVNKAYNYSIKFEGNKLPFSMIKNEIANNAPVITDLNSSTTYGHSIVLMGYTAPKNGDITSYLPYYFYWNPWWEDTFIVSSNSKYMTLGQTKYEWYRTLYNFRRGKYQDKIGTVVTLQSFASQYQTGENIPTNLRNKEYSIKDVKEVKQSNSKLAYYLDGLNKWVLEQDVKQYATPLLNKNVLLLSKATHAQTGEFLDSSLRNKRYSAIQVKPVRQSNSKLAYYLNGLNRWILEQDLSQ